MTRFPGFTETAPARDGHYWTADGAWALVEEEHQDRTTGATRKLWRLVAEDGLRSDQALSEADAMRVIASAGTGDDLMHQWDLYAPPRR